MRKIRWISLILLVTFFTSLVPFQYAQAITPSTLRAKFDSLDSSVSNGNWYKTSNNDSGGLAWNESYVMNAYMIMYEVTKDTKYLDKLADHATSVLSTRDSVRGVKDYRGLSLPAWSAANSNYTINGQRYIFSGHTGVITYPMAEFVRVVYKNPDLWPKYKTKADTLLKAVKAAVAVHDDEWRQSGDIGWYIERKGAPEKWDGVNIPFNLMLAMTRTQLAIWQATGDEFYYNRIKRMTQVFKNHLSSDSTGAYMWHYTWGDNYDGWTAADNLSTNSPSYAGYKRWEDLSHGAIDVDFAALAYDAGIIFTATDMKKFGLTVEKKLLRSDGTVASTVQGTNVSSNTNQTGRWLRLNKWAPSLFNYVYNFSHSGATGLLTIALLNQANLENQGLFKPTDPSPPTTPPTTGTGTVPTPDPGSGTIPPLGENQVDMIANGAFNEGRNSWGGTQGSINTEASGNQFAVNGYNWQFYQDFQLVKGTDFKLNAKTKKETATTEARFTIGFYDAAGNSLPYFNFRYQHQGAGWEAIPETPVSVPDGAVKARLYLLVDGGTGTHDFDNITFRATVNPVPEPVTPPDTTKPVISQLSANPNEFIADGIAKTTINYQLSESAQVKAYIVNKTGMPVRTLFLGSLAAGNQTMTWDGKDENGNILIPGAYTLQIEASDQAGNQSAPGVAAITLLADTISPTVNIEDPVDGAHLRAEKLIKASAADNIGVTGVYFEYALEGQTTWNKLGDAILNSGSWNLNWDTTALADGKYNLRAVALDQAGNMGYSQQVQVIIDNTNPVVAKIETPIFISGTAPLKTTASDLSLDKVTFEYGPSTTGPWTVIGNGTEASGSWTIPWNTKAAADGDYYLRAVAVDKAGNSTISLRKLVTVDNTKPVISQLSAIPAEFKADGMAKTTILYQLSERVQVKAYILNKAGMPVRTLFQGSLVAGNQTMTWDGKDNNGNILSGVYTLQIEVIDSAGNQSTSSFTDITLVNPAELVINGTFTEDKYSWSSDGIIKTESSGNKYVEAVYGWHLYQDLKLTIGKKYQLNALTRKGTATIGTRIVIAHFNDAGKIFASENRLYTHNGTGWESIASHNFTVPNGTAFTRVYLLTNGGTDTVDYDAISILQI